jgi:TRAP-type C4-dicarboxylate transport system substrate-binding protein
MHRKTNRGNMRQQLTKTIACAALVMSTHLGAQEPIELKFNVWVPQTSWFQTEAYGPWAKDIERATDGRVRVSFTTASVGAANRQLDLVKSGIVDAAMGAHGYTPGVFPLSGVAELPFLSKNGERLGAAMWQVHQKYPAFLEEYRGTKVLNVWGHTGVILLQRSEDPITAVDQFKGMKIRVAAPAMADIVTKLGGAPVNQPASSTYELLARGVVDGALWTYDAWDSFKLQGVVKSATIVPGHFGNGTVYTVVNADSWRKISKKDQDAIMACCAGVSSSATMGAVWDRVGARVKDKMLKAGVKFHTLSAAETAKLHQQLQFIQDAWVKQANAKGLDGKAILRSMMEWQEQYRPAAK